MLSIRGQIKEVLVDRINGIAHLFNLVKHGGGGELHAQQFLNAGLAVKGNPAKYL